MTGTGAYLAVFLLMTLAFIVAGCAMLAARYYRRRRARRFAGKASTGKASTGKASIGKAGG